MNGYGPLAANGSSDKQEKFSGKVKDVHVHLLDDGSYQVSVVSDKGGRKETSHQDKKDLMECLSDYFGDGKAKSAKDALTDE